MTQAKADGGRTAHTPGPFHLDCTYVLDERGRTVAACAVSPRVNRAEQIANANLFAAAPDLVKALESCQRVLADLISGDKSLSTINLYAQAVEAELKARAALSSSRSDQQ